MIQQGVTVGWVTLRVGRVEIIQWILLRELLETVITAVLGHKLLQR